MLLMHMLRDLFLLGYFNKSFPEFKHFPVLLLDVLFFRHFVSPVEVMLALICRCFFCSIPVKELHDACMSACAIVCMCIRVPLTRKGTMILFLRPVRGKLIHCHLPKEWGVVGSVMVPHTTGGHCFLSPEQFFQHCVAISLWDANAAIFQGFFYVPSECNNPLLQLFHLNTSWICPIHMACGPFWSCY